MSKRYNRGKGRFKRGGVNNLSCQRIRSVPFSVPSFYLEQASTGNGGFSTAGSAASITAQNGFAVDPFNLGGIVYQMAALYSRYRLKNCRITYIPFTTQSGVVSNVSGATASPNYGDRAFAVHYTEDPAFSSSNFISMLAAGGKVCNTSRRFTLGMSGNLASSWKYSSTTSASPTTIDLRDSSTGRVEIAFSDTSTTATARYGIFILSGVAEFEGLIDRAVVIGNSEEKENKQESPESIAGPVPPFIYVQSTNQKQQSGPITNKEQKPQQAGTWFR